jgi:hypothetical protein
MTQLICDADSGEGNSQGDDSGDCPGQWVVDRGKVPCRLCAYTENRFHLLPPDSPDTSGYPLG